MTSPINLQETLLFVDLKRLAMQVILGLAGKRRLIFLNSMALQAKTKKASH